MYLHYLDVHIGLLPLQSVLLSRTPFLVTQIPFSGTACKVYKLLLLLCVMFGLVLQCFYCCTLIVQMYF